MPPRAPQFGYSPAGVRLDDPGSTFPEHVQARQVLRIEAELDATSDERRIDGVPIAGQRDGRGAGDAAQD